MAEAENEAYTDAELKETLQSLRSTDTYLLGAVLKRLISKPTKAKQILQALEDLLHNKGFFRLEAGAQHSYSPINLAAALALANGRALEEPSPTVELEKAMLVVTRQDKHTWNSIINYQLAEKIPHLSGEKLLKVMRQLYERGKLKSRKVVVEPGSSLKAYKFRPLDEHPSGQ